MAHDAKYPSHSESSPIRYYWTHEVQWGASGLVDELRCPAIESRAWWLSNDSGRQTAFHLARAENIEMRSLRRVQGTAEQRAQEGRRLWRPSVGSYHELERALNASRPVASRLRSRSGDALAKEISKLHGARHRRPPPLPTQSWEASPLASCGGWGGRHLPGHFERHATRDLGSACLLAKCSALCIMHRACASPPWAHVMGTPIYDRIRGCLFTLPERDLAPDRGHMLS